MPRRVSRRRLPSRTSRPASRWGARSCPYRRQTSTPYRADAAALGLEKNARVVRGDVAAGLAALVADDGTGFDVVFLDPPFKVDAAAVAEEAAVLVARLGVLVWRVPRGRVLPPRVGVLALTRQRRYGISKVGSYT